jgi:hypothetical protein
MRVSSPVRSFAASGIAAITGFIGLLVFVPVKGQSYIPIWRDAICYLSVFLWVFGLAGMRASFVWWIAMEFLTRRKLKLMPPPSSH